MKTILSRLSRGRREDVTNDRNDMNNSVNLHDINSMNNSVNSNDTT